MNSGEFPLLVPHRSWHGCLARGVSYALKGPSVNVAAGCASRALRTSSLRRRRVPPEFADFNSVEVSPSERGRRPTAAAKSAVVGTAIGGRLAVAGAATSAWRIFGRRERGRGGGLPASARRRWPGAGLSIGVRDCIAALRTTPYISSCKRRATGSGAPVSV